MSIRMRQNRSVHSALVNEVHILACQIVKAVQIYRLLTDDNLLSACLNVENRLEHCPGTVLDELSHGVQVCGQVNGGREDASADIYWA